MSTKPDPSAEPAPEQANASEESYGANHLSDYLVPNTLAHLPLLIASLTFLYSEVRAALTGDRPTEEPAVTASHRIANRLLLYTGHADRHEAQTDDETSIAISRLKDLVRSRSVRPGFREADTVLEREQEQAAPDPHRLP